MPDIDTSLDWESALGQLLDELSEVQEQLLAVLTTKREQLATADIAGLAETQLREQELADRLQDCQRKRSDLLAAARQQGATADSLGKLAKSARGESRGKLDKRTQAAAANMRLLRHQSLANWVLAQRALLHVSQLVEIIATGGRLQPTYGEGESVHARGSLVNHEA
jgi:flagellar biosynthesis/type III secretory pathway chaperone